MLVTMATTFWRGWHNDGERRTLLVRHSRCRMPLLAVVLLSLAVAPVSGVAQDGAMAEGRDDRGAWLQLRRDQTVYRERVEPLDLRDQRRLEAVERGQGLELEAVLQRQRLERSRRRLRERRLGAGGDRPGDAARRGDMANRHRQLIQEQRLRTRIQQQTLPYHRR
jgi:hypothetical protein